MFHRLIDGIGVPLDSKLKTELIKDLKYMAKGQLHAAQFMEFCEEIPNRIASFRSSVDDIEDSAYKYDQQFGLQTNPQAEYPSRNFNQSSPTQFPAYDNLYTIDKVEGITSVGEGEKVDLLKESDGEGRLSAATIESSANSSCIDFENLMDAKNAISEEESRFFLNNSLSENIVTKDVILIDNVTESDELPFNIS